MTVTLWNVMATSGGIYNGSYFCMGYTDIDLRLGDFLDIRKVPGKTQ